MNDRIRISLDDVNSQDVDSKLAAQNALNRTNEHYQSQMQGAISTNQQNNSGSIWRNTFFYMTIFGIIGGILAWAPAEIVWSFNDDSLDEYIIFNNELENLRELLISDDITQSTFMERMQALTALFSDNPFVEIESDEYLSDDERNSKFEELLSDIQSRAYFISILFFAFVGSGLAICLSAAEAVVSKNIPELIKRASVGLCFGMLGGVIVGLFIDALYNAMGGGEVDTSFVMQVLARATGFLIVGIFVAIAPGIVMKNWKKIGIGLLGGSIGGLIGGSLFDPIASVVSVGWPSRLIALVCIGLFTGMAIGLIENVLKSGWVRVVGGPITGKQFILYKNPTTVGSSPQCDIYLFKDRTISPHHASISRVPQGFQISSEGESQIVVNGQTTRRHVLRSNDQISIGGSSFSFHQKQQG